MIQANPKNPEIKTLLVQTAKTIGVLTSEMIAIGENELQKRLVNLCKECASNAKNLLVNIHSPYDTFFGFCKGFAGSAMQVSVTLQEIARKVDDQTHQQQIVVAYNGIREVSPSVIRSAKRAYETPDNEEFTQELQLAVKNLAGKITYALSVAQIDGHKEEISKKQPTISIPKIDVPPQNEDSTVARSRRKKTVKNPEHGNQILQQAKTATVAKNVEDDLEEGSLIAMEQLKQKATVPNQQKKVTITTAVNTSTPSTSTQNTPTPTTVQPLPNSLEEKDMDDIESTFRVSTKIEDWKGKYEELKQKYDFIVAENERLRKFLTQK